MNYCRSSSIRQEPDPANVRIRLANSRHTVNPLPHGRGAGRSAAKRPKHTFGVVGVASYQDVDQGGDHSFARIPPALIFDESLMASERLLLIALRYYDWGNGDGCFPSNATLIKATGLKATGPDGGSNHLRRLLKSLKDQGYIRIETFKASKDNPTGRLIHVVTPHPVHCGQDRDKTTLDPAPARAVHECTESPYRGSPPAPTGAPPPAPTGAPNRPKRIDPENRSSEDDDLSVSQETPGQDSPTVATVRAAALAAFGNRAKLGPIVAKVPEWMAMFAGSLLDPIATILDAVKVAGEKVKHPGGEIGYIEKTIKSRIANPPANPAKKSPAVPDADESVRLRKLREQSDSMGEAAAAILKARWDNLIDADRDHIDNLIFAKTPEFRGRHLRLVLQAERYLFLDKIPPPEPIWTDAALSVTQQPFGDDDHGFPGPRITAHG
jgi:hypothetical protein